MKLNENSEITISVVWLIQIVVAVVIATFGYATISERIDNNQSETKSLRSNQNNYVFPDIRKLEDQVIDLQKKVLILETELKYKEKERNADA